MKGTLWYAGLTEDELEFLKRRFEEHLDEHIDFTCKEDKNLIGGFLAHINGIAYDMSLRSRLNAVRGALGGDHSAEANSEDLREALPRRFADFHFDMEVYRYGHVSNAGDGIIHVRGLPNCRSGELLNLSGGAVAMVLEVTETLVGAAVLTGEVKVGEEVIGSGHVMDVPVGSAVLGRVLSPTGEPLDGGLTPRCPVRRPIESPAPRIMDRAGVDRPVQTGLLSIDSMIPIGRGQRELIIGDRQTGKTTIALDTILNQKDQDVICVYCAIGQKASTVAQVVETLTKNGSMDYTVVVSAPASDLPAMQYIAPYAACAIAEGFMYDGQDVLVIYDDLSKHAVAYRAMSLLLHRPPGREAYPGDVFYLHSRLLERSAQLSEELGGGSLTAIPIVETMAGDISAYIPTNVISITDGQIFLESELFHAGMRPAVNVGLSVSRVGRSAQRPAMRKVTGTLRMDLAQYREMSVFLQFGADVDSATHAMLEDGARKNELLKQAKNAPYSLREEVCLLLAADAGIFGKVPVSQVGELSRWLLEKLEESEKLSPILSGLEMSGDFSDAVRDELKQAMEELAEEYVSRQS